MRSSGEMRWAPQADATKEVQNQAAEAALRARRRAGELLAETVEHGGDRRSESRLQPATLNDHGVSKTQSSRWQAIADIPEEKFETFIAETQTLGRELTTAGAVAVARGRNPIHPAARRWLTKAETTTNYQQNCQRFMTRYPGGLAPYIVGLPVIA